MRQKRQPSEKSTSTPDQQLNMILNQVDHALNELEAEGKQSFFWASESIEDTLFRPYEPLPNKSEAKKRLDHVLEKHRATFNFCRELSRQIQSAGMNRDIISDEEFRKAIDGYRKIVAELQEKESVAPTPAQIKKNRFQISQILSFFH